MLVLALVALSYPLAAASAASGLPATITMTPDNAAPGTVVEVVGLDFPPEGTVELQVTTTAGPVALGTTTATSGGYFRQAVTLPTDVEPGFWELRATGPGGVAAVQIFEAGAAAGVADTGVAPVAAASAPLIDPNLVVTIVLLLLLIVMVCAAVFVYGVTHAQPRKGSLPVGDDPIWSGAGGDGP
jgi:hypothetical protein